MSVPLNDPRVAVVVATRDRCRSLDRTLTKLEEVPERPRVVVVDNGSGDRTPHVARTHPRVELIELGHNRGAAARNVGVRRVESPYVAFSDDDSWWARGALRRAADLLDAHPRVGLLACRIHVGEQERLDPTCVEMRKSALGEPPGGPGPRVLGFIACGTVVRRDAFLATGGFDDRLGLGGEERLLAIDLARGGWECCYADEVVACHHPSSRRDRDRRTRLLTRNAMWSAWLRRPLGSALRISTDLVRNAIFDGPGRAGVWDAFAGGLWVLSERDPVPAELDEDLNRAYMR